MLISSLTQFQAPNFRKPHQSISFLLSGRWPCSIKKKMKTYPCLQLYYYLFVPKMYKHKCKHINSDQIPETDKKIYIPMEILSLKNFCDDFNWVQCILKIPGHSQMQIVNLKNFCDYGVNIECQWQNVIHYAFMLEIQDGILSFYHTM